MKPEFGPVIANRKYFCARDMDPAHAIGIEIAAPAKSPDHDDFSCSFRVMSPTFDRSETVYGIDALQSLLLALGYVQAILRELGSSSGGTLKWAAGDAEDFGIRIPQFWDEKPSHPSGEEQR
jgi:hypothetical protein